ncbi:MAG: CopG family antitoxin [Thermodesulfobacteriota bacterium]|nr:CopG family antitoxin [Thermodesulfobacteriota bacterium]
MEEKKKNSIPEHFKSAEDAGNFWDTHDLADYWDQARETDLTFNLKRRHYFIGIAPKIAQELQMISDAEGISAETMVNLWLQEKLQERMVTQ